MPESLYRPESPKSNPLSPTNTPPVVRKGKFCSTCHHWAVQGEHISVQVGECHLNPPIVIDPSKLTQFGPLGRFMLTLADSVCGQHKPR
jgi:hypothetical protein